MYSVIHRVIYAQNGNLSHCFLAKNSIQNQNEGLISISTFENILLDTKDYLPNIYIFFLCIIQ